uniref:C2H2-type domain-containing protein n=1 Tax=Parastrongyloides trichosuri TaxID=131310 RepID=A0A0N4Z8Z8_PARTI
MNGKIPKKDTFQCPHCNKKIKVEDIMDHVMNMFGFYTFKCLKCPFATNNCLLVKYHEKDTNHKCQTIVGINKSLNKAIKSTVAIFLEDSQSENDQLYGKIEVDDVLPSLRTDSKDYNVKQSNKPGEAHDVSDQGMDVRIFNVKSDELLSNPSDSESANKQNAINNVLCETRKRKGYSTILSSLESDLDISYKKNEYTPQNKKQCSQKINTIVPVDSQRLEKFNSSASIISLDSSSSSETYATCEEFLQNETKGYFSETEMELEYYKNYGFKDEYRNFISETMLKNNMVGHDDFQVEALAKLLLYNIYSTKKRENFENVTQVNNMGENFRRAKIAAKNIINKENLNDRVRVEIQECEEYSWLDKFCLSFSNTLSSH